MKSELPGTALLSVSGVRVGRLPACSPHTPTSDSTDPPFHTPLCRQGASRWQDRPFGGCCFAAAPAARCCCCVCNAGACCCPSCCLGLVGSKGVSNTQSLPSDCRQTSLRASHPLGATGPAGLLVLHAVLHCASAQPPPPLPVPLPVARRALTAVQLSGATPV